MLSGRISTDGLDMDTALAHHALDDIVKHALNGSSPDRNLELNLNGEPYRLIGTPRDAIGGTRLDRLIVSSPLGRLGNNFCQIANAVLIAEALGVREVAVAKLRGIRVREPIRYDDV